MVEDKTYVDLLSGNHSGEQTLSLQLTNSGGAWKANSVGAPARMMTGIRLSRQLPEGRAAGALFKRSPKMTCLLLRFPRTLRLHYLLAEKPTRPGLEFRVVLLSSRLVDIS